MKAIKISDKAWEYAKQMQIELALKSGEVKALGEIVSEALLNGVKP